jgi:hypothetical protein
MQEMAMNMTQQSRRYSVLAATWITAALLSATLPAAEPPPAVSSDGLHLVKQTSDRLVYLKPGASFAQYQRVAILDCYVEFQKNWQQNYNMDAPTLDSRVSDADVQRMKTAIAAEFKRVFTQELQKNGGYQVVDVAAPDVLLLRPALINVAVTAPDIQSASMEATIVRSAGQATLYLELWDSATKTILARVMDAKAANEPVAEVANRVTNTAAADEVLRGWADDLRRHLDAVRAKPQGQ